MTTTKIVTAVIEADYTAIYAVLVWTGVLLAVAWTILMYDDPANTGLPGWDLRLRRTGVLIMVAGFLVSVLFAGNQGWTPWPPMILIVFGFDFYLGAALLTGYQRAKLRERVAKYNSFTEPSDAAQDRPFYAVRN